MEKVLIVEDEQRIRDIIYDYLNAHGLCCDVACNGEEALSLFYQNIYDVLILDILMPKLDGYALCKEIRQNHQVPILFLSALDSEDHTLKGYALGCDDYLTKPFSLAILLAKTKALLRRYKGSTSRSILSCGAITLDIQCRICKVNNQEIKLSFREFDLLQCLIQHQGQVLSRNQLLDKVWGIDYDGEDRAVDVRIRSLRSQLGPAASQIKTVFKIGYKIEEV